MPWLFWLLLVVTAAVVVLAAVRPGGTGRRREAESPRRVANSAAMFLLPRVRSRVRQQRWLHAGAGLLVLVALLAAAGVSARPVSEVERSDRLANRDIVLCLDVSTSMITIDASVLETFSGLLDSFDGERVALVAWNSTAQTIVPLTDDYELLGRQMEDLADVLDIDPASPTSRQVAAYEDALSGTMSYSVEGSSLAGDGLASCAMAFDNQGMERSRSVILATDNLIIDPDGEQIYSLADSVQVLGERSIRLFSVYGTDPDQYDLWVTEKTPEEAREELMTLTQDSGGRFYDVEDSGTGGDIVRQLEETQVAELAGGVETRRTDTPEYLAAALGVAVVALLGLAAWRRL